MDAVETRRAGLQISWYECGVYVDRSDSRRIRGFCLAQLREEPEGIGHYHVLKSAIDTTQGPWTITCGEFVHTQWDEGDPAEEKSHVSFDGTRGQVCFTHPDAEDDIVVVDIE